MTYKEIIYLILDELKMSSDDSYYTEDHVKFLCNKYRTLLLKQRYSDVKKQIPESNYQSICINLTSKLDSSICTIPNLVSTDKLPYLMKIGNINVTPLNFYQGINITMVSRDRMRYVGNNKYMQNIIYCSLNPDNYLEFTSSNPQFKYLEKVMVTGIFEDAEQACLQSCNKECDIMDCTFPIEGALINPLVEMVVKELLGAEYRPMDDQNNAKDDISDIIAWARRNMKSNIQKQIEG